jgi:hypothetical protein
MPLPSRVSLTILRAKSTQTCRTIRLISRSKLGNRLSQCTSGDVRRAETPTPRFALSIETEGAYGYTAEEFFIDGDPMGSVALAVVADFQSLLFDDVRGGGGRRRRPTVPTQAADVNSRKNLAPTSPSTRPSRLRERVHELHLAFHRRDLPCCSMTRNSYSSLLASPLLPPFVIIGSVR